MADDLDPDELDDIHLEVGLRWLLSPDVPDDFWQPE
jgi:hypothetical protein